MDKSSNSQNPTITPPSIPQSETVTLTPPQHPKKIMLIIILILGCVGIGVGSFIFGLKRGGNKIDPINNPPNIPTTAPRVTTVVRPTIAPTVGSAGWKTETLSISREIVDFGYKKYNFEFQYPENWNIQRKTETHSNDPLMQNCTDYNISNIDEQVFIEIKMICTGWSANYQNVPADYQIVSKQENQGNDGHTSYVVRYFSPIQWIYDDVAVMPGQNITKTDKTTGALLVSYAPDDYYFIPIKVRLSAFGENNISENAIEVADTLVKSLKLVKNDLRTITRRYWEFQVPSSWNYWECSDDTIFVGPQVTKDQVGGCAFDSNPGVLAVKKVKPTPSTLEEAIPKTEETTISYNDGRSEVVREPIISSIKYLTIDNHESIYWQEEIKTGPGQGKYINAFELSTSTKIQLDDLSYKDTFDQILTTVKLFD